MHAAKAKSARFTLQGMDRGILVLVVILVSGCAVLVAWAIARQFQSEPDERVAGKV